MPRKSFWIAASCILALLGLLPVLSSGASPASKEKVLYSFTGGVDGGVPMSDLIFDSAGNLYGTTSQGGNLAACNGSGCGTVFELKHTADGWKEEVLYSFGGYQSDGIFPQAGVIFDRAGNLYGTTWAGAGDSSFEGTVFRLSPNAHGGWQESVLYGFTGGSDGGGPQADLVFDSQGNLYGTASQGGSGGNSCFESGCGTVFELTPQPDGSWTETTIHIFTDTGGDGAQPSSGVVPDSAGDLYGVTEYGGAGSCQNSDINGSVIRGCGTLYKLTLNSGRSVAENVVYSFVPGGGSGIYPSGEPVFDRANRLLAPTQAGGDGFGTVFELEETKRGWRQSEAHIFDGNPDGARPVGRLTMDVNGNMFGATSSGAAVRHEYGTVFEIERSKNVRKEKILHSFAGPPDGASPSAGLVSDSQGHLYGTTTYGGNGGCVHLGCGTVYEVAP
jgi:uncharacterized repeat protein (TIGR03803 family)